MTRQRAYHSVLKVIDDGHDPHTISTRLIRLSATQHKRLAELGDTWQKYNGQASTYDTLADWRLIECRQTTCRITSRGRTIMRKLGKP